MGFKPRKSIDPDRWEPIGTAGGLRVELNPIGAVRMVVPETGAHWVLLPWEVPPLAGLLAEVSRAIGAPDTES